MQDGVYVLDIDGAVPTVSPGVFGSALPEVAPRRYFITSGDAVVKAGVLCRDLEALVAAAAAEGNARLVAAAEVALAAARALRVTLVEFRGVHTFLELEWSDHKLFCIPKDPRKRDRP